MIDPRYKAPSVEGILTLHDPEMRKLYDLKVAGFVNRFR
jgi:uridine kinase